MNRTLFWMSVIYWILETQQWDKRPHDGNVVRSNGSKGEKHRRGLLVKAGALILAEIERIDRAESSAGA